MNPDSVRIKPGRKSRICGAVVLAATAVICHPVSVQACAACFGKSDSPLAKGMNWGIMSLLCVVGVVLSIFSAFFVFLAKKAGSVPVPSGPTVAPGSSNRIET